MTDEDIARLLAEPDEVRDLLESEEGPAVLDLDKAWHGIHFLLTCTAWEGAPPLDFLVRGGTQVGDEDVGYAPSRILGRAEVRAIRDELAELSDEMLLERYDAPAMMHAEIEPEIWTRWSKEEALDYLFTNVTSLRQFLDAMVRDEMGLLVCVT